MSGVVKWNLPPEPVPSWLDPAAELRVAPADMPAPGASFVLAAMVACLAFGVTPRQAAGVVANSINETGWGKHCRGYNCGGWKITKGYATKHPGAAWWRAPGNKSSGDSPWCYYRAFGSFGAYFAEWLDHFTPRPGVDRDGDGDVDADDERGRSALYRRTGDLFWSGGDWFPALIAGGYKGPITKAKPAGSIREHAKLVQSALTLWAQSRLGVEVDGAWGPKSRQACREYQLACDLPVSGERDDATLAALAATAPTTPA